MVEHLDSKQHSNRMQAQSHVALGHATVIDCVLQDFELKCHF